MDDTLKEIIARIVLETGLDKIILSSAHGRRGMNWNGAITTYVS
jgi:hypothetical protein